MNQLTETTKWPWHLNNSDVIVRDPHDPDTRGEWPVIGEPTFANGHTVITVDTGDGGEGYFVFSGAEQVTVRAGKTYTAAPTMTAQQRERAIDDMAADSRLDNPHGQLLRFAAVVLAGFPEIFDAAYMRVERHATHDASKETTR